MVLDVFASFHRAAPGRSGPWAAGRWWRVSAGRRAWRPVSRSLLDASDRPAPVWILPKSYGLLSRHTVPTYTLTGGEAVVGPTRGPLRPRVGSGSRRRLHRPLHAAQPRRTHVSLRAVLSSLTAALACCVGSPNHIVEGAAICHMSFRPEGPWFSFLLLLHPSPDPLPSPQSRSSVRR